MSRRRGNREVEGAFSSRERFTATGMARSSPQRLPCRGLVTSLGSQVGKRDMQESENVVEYATYPSQKTCRLCGAGYGDLRIEFGKLPPCNRFVDSAETLPSHQLTMGACGNCGLIQLLDPMPPDMVRPRVPWIRYNEPSAHLGGVADRILEAIGRRPITALGIGPFEQPLLEELRQRDVVADAPQLNFQPTDGTPSPISKRGRPNSLAAPSRVPKANVVRRTLLVAAFSWSIATPRSTPCTPWVSSRRAMAGCHRGPG